MSTFNSYAKRFDEIARTTFAQLIDAETELTAAENRRKETPMKTGVLVPADYQAKAARRESEYQTAKASHEAVNKSLPDQTMKAVGELRAELAAAISDKYAARPSDLDHDALVLLDSNILTADEYWRLFRDAETITMRRVIAARAGKAAEAAEKDGDREAARTLRVIQNAGSDDGRGYLQTYDFLLDVLQRCLRNRAMIDRWNDLTSAAIENF